MKVSWSWFSYFKQSPVFGLIFQKSGEVFILAEVQWWREWAWRGGSALPWAASILFCKWDQEQSFGERLPFALSLPLLCPAIPMSQSSELWDYDPVVGSLFIFQVLYFSFQLWEGRGALCFVSHDHTFFPPSTKLTAYSFPNAGKGISQASPQHRCRVLCGGC